MAIRQRYNSLFYRSQRGARVGDVCMTLIYTAELHRQNPFHYMTALLEHEAAVAADPAAWLPWNYLHALARASPATISHPMQPRSRCRERRPRHVAADEWHDGHPDAKHRQRRTAGPSGSSRCRRWGRLRRRHGDLHQPPLSMLHDAAHDPPHQTA
jgi:hypothetical protein